MPHPKGGYRLKDGSRVPGTTTILGKVGDKNGMIYAANRLALEPLLKARHLLELAATDTTGAWLQDVWNFLGLDQKRWDHKEAWGTAADAGTAGHDMFDCYVRGVPFDPKPYTAEVIAIATPAFEAAKEWAAQSKFKVVETEVSLVSERYRFGGTRDGILVSGKRCLADVKTSKAIYPEYLAQLGAYAILDEEAGNTIDGGFHILRFSKQEKAEDPVMFEHRYWSNMDAGKKAFLVYREAYEVMGELERLCK
jgi:hypothetical protein